MCSFTFIIWKRAAWTFCSMIKSNAVQNKMMVSKLWLNLHSPLTIMILLSHNIYHLRAQTRSHEKWHSNLCSQSTGWRNWSSLEVRRLCHFYRTQSSHQRPTAKQESRKLAKVKICSTTQWYICLQILLPTLKSLQKLQTHMRELKGMWMPERDRGQCKIR